METMMRTGCEAQPPWAWEGGEATAWPALLGDGWAWARLAAQTCRRPLGGGLWSELASGIDRRSGWRARWWPVRLRTAGVRGWRESPAAGGLSGPRTPAEAKVGECRGLAFCRGPGARNPSRRGTGDTSPRPSPRSRRRGRGQAVGLPAATGTAQAGQSSSGIIRVMAGCGSSMSRGPQTATSFTRRERTSSLRT